MTIREVPAPVVRHVMATAMLGARRSIAERIGGVVLRPHQRNAAARVLDIIRAGGGALLAERVGRGKTYVSLAVASQLGGDIAVVAPAALRDMWTDALRLCGMSATIVSHEALSRGAPAPGEPAVIIVDESHRFRSPATRRYARMAEWCRRSRVLLVTATPLQNRRSDLAAQLALFLGRQAWQMSDDELARHVVRDAAELTGVPRIEGPHKIELAAHDDCLDELLALPPPIPARDESLAVTLLTYGLVHQWTSSRAALLAALERRRARGLALSAAVESGRSPTRAELAAWTHAGDAMQLAFPELVTSAAADGVDDNQLLAALTHHVRGVEALIHRLRAAPDPDDDRASALRRVRAAHPGERIIAFCHYAETVSTLWSRLARDAHVAALTASGARIASGRVSREYVLRQFMPSAQGTSNATDTARIGLLITTDLLSEGLNLQEASVVVHLDLPWNPARLEQRVGRACRLGSRHPVVSVYSICPPTAAERLLQIEHRLRSKLSLAGRTVGIAGCILPSPIVLGSPSPGLAEQSTAIERAVSDWRDPSDLPVALDGDTLVGAALGPRGGFLALVYDSDGARLVADIGHGISTSTATIAAAVDFAQHGSEAQPEGAGDEALARVERWIGTQHGSATIDFHAAAAASSRRAALARVAQALARAPRHRRALLVPLAEAARAVATAPLGEGAERILETLVQAQLPDEAWLRSIATFSDLNARPPRVRPSPIMDRGRVVALLLFDPGGGSLQSRGQEPTLMSETPPGLSQ